MAAQLELGANSSDMVGGLAQRRAAAAAQLQTPPASTIGCSKSRVCRSARSSRRENPRAPLWRTLPTSRKRRRLHRRNRQPGQKTPRESPFAHRQACQL